MSKSKIEWTGETWNPVTGCTKISAGCKNCYAETMAKRLQKMGTRGYENGFAVTVQSDGAFERPLRCKKPTTYFVCSMSDLFHESVSSHTQERVMQIIEQCPQHTFQILTKRPENMRYFFENRRNREGVNDSRKNQWRQVPKNVWLGVTCENQETADERIPHLLSIDATVRFLSIEPMLGAITFQRQVNSSWSKPLYKKPLDGIHWVIVGGESGKNARPMHPDWARSIRDQCAAANVPFFFKQWGEWCHEEQYDFDLKSKSPSILIDKDGAVYSEGYAEKVNCLFKVGKKRAGRLLDGVIHDGMPNKGVSDDS